MPQIDTVVLDMSRLGIRELDSFKSPAIFRS
jgi:hypothetical protein